ncbi:MAG TPA: PASTA domain-containing protein [Gemmatimonadaceae bacterium]|jgi:beta-lactam-binding protein with PASTA domain
MQLLKWSTTVAIGLVLSVAMRGEGQVAGVAAPTSGVPNVVGLRFDSAAKVLTRYRLLVRANAKSDGSKAAATDTVIQQNPRAGQPVPITRAVSLDLKVQPPVASDGGDGVLARRRVPNITGITLDSARRILSLNRLSMRMTTIPNNVSTNGQDIVAQQTPEPRSQIPSDRTIAAQVRVDLIQVPNVGGLTLAVARRQLGRFEIREQLEPNQATTNTIFRQDPAPLTRVRPLSTVTIYIAQAMQPVQRVVPNVVGASLQDANNILARSGFHAGRVTDDDDANVSPGGVVTQLPRAGQSADTAIGVALSVRSNRVRMPSVLTLSEADARQQLTSSGLQIGTVDPRDDPGSPGSIVSQSLTAGTLVERGSVVSLNIARPMPLAMPNIVGLSRSAAISLINQRGLVVALVDTSATQTRPDTVVAQSPIAQSTIRPGDRVRFTVGGRVIAQTPPIGSTPDSAPAITTPTPRDTIVVPDIVGLTRTQASAVASRAGFALVVSPGQSPTTADTIVKQFPAARSTVPAGSRVLMAEFSVTVVPARPLWIIWLAVGIAVLGVIAKTVWPKPKPPTPVVILPITYAAGVKAPSFSITDRRSTHGLELSLSVKNDPGVQAVVVTKSGAQ